MLVTEEKKIWYFADFVPFENIKKRKKFESGNAVLRINISFFSYLLTTRNSPNQGLFTDEWTLIVMLFGILVNGSYELAIVFLVKKMLVT